ncbi:hypothetical protein CBM2604_U40008 [Cupriavidus taiwanensis]|nr:hypothetical protein CBM2604_U40008 [Cupriavidus taiwanensis]
MRIVARLRESERPLSGVRVGRPPLSFSSGEGVPVVPPLCNC